jgi:DNA-binding NarL/FixJ family response regulator
MLTIGLIDNHSLTREALCIILDTHFKKNTEMLGAKDISEFDRLYSGKGADLVIMGVNQVSEEDSVYQLRKSIPKVPVVVYLDHLYLDVAVHFFRSGINGYLLKQNSISDMIECIEKVLNGKLYLCPELFELVLQSNFKPY